MNSSCGTDNTGCHIVNSADGGYDVVYTEYTTTCGVQSEMKRINIDIISTPFLDTRGLKKALYG